MQFWRSTLLSTVPGVVHAVTRRRGGVSQPPFATLNVGLHVGDRKEDVIANRRRVLGALGFPLERVVAGEQVHGAQVADVSEADVGKGAFSYTDAVPGVDALVTASPAVPLLGYFADCLPLLFAHRRGGWIACAHAGWKGTLAGVAAGVVDRFVHEYGGDPGDLVVALGPSIRPCCYEVSVELAERFHRAFGAAALGRARSGKLSVDLVAANVALLQRKGISSGQIDISPECTACRTDLYFSHRVEGPRTGRIGAVIAITP